MPEMNTAKVLPMTSALILTLILAVCGGSSAAQEHFAAGAELQKQGQFEAAITEYEEAIRLDPDYRDAYTNQGAAYLILDRPEKATQSFGEWIRLGPEDGAAYANRALSFTHLGKDLEAQKDVERAVALGIGRDQLERTIEDMKGQR
ncbi:MAG: hypothetical protein BZY88_01440 [SAR202 cluster bacterium Io17-Chloro-G9]|nr:MAG: hypothetical protein BZY88_01440 [SAR202 cluster bacterium Io17-Chloro-G9]